MHGVHVTLVFFLLTKEIQLVDLAICSHSVMMANGSEGDEMEGFTFPTCDKAKNDPWVPLEVTSTEFVALPTPLNPHYQLIESEKYIKSLEDKLAKLTQKRKLQKEPTSRDIINSLAVFHDEQMNRYIEDNEARFPVDAYISTDDSPVVQSFLYRRLYPERQSLNTEEAVELVKGDSLAENFDNLQISAEEKQLQHPRADVESDNADTVSTPNHLTRTREADIQSNSISESSTEKASKDQCADESSEDPNWANFDKWNDEKD